MMRRSAFTFALMVCLSIVAHDAQAAIQDQSPSTAASGQADPATPRPTVPAAAAPAPSATTAKPGAAQKPDANAVATGKPVQADSIHTQRKAAKLYLKGVRLLEKQQPEAAWDLLKQAASLQPTNDTYVRAAELARQSAVTQLVQESSRERAGISSASKHAVANQDPAGLLHHALEIDPKNPLALQHLDELGDATSHAGVGATASVALKTDDSIRSDTIAIEPAAGKHSFHLRSDTRQVVKDVFKAYGIDASVHDSVQSKPTRLDIDDATFPEAMRVLGMLTHTFYEALDGHRVIVATDTRENRTQFQRMQMQTFYLPGLTDKELTDVSNLARNVFDAQQAVAEPTSDTLTLRAPARTLEAFNRTITPLVDGKSQLDLNVKVIELSHVSASETGTKFFQQTGVYNVFSEINSVLSQNQSLVQQIIASGLVPNQSTLTNQIEILAILVASGQLTGTPFNQGFLPFGGGLTQSILSPSPATLTLSLNTSDTRMLDDIHMRLGDDEAGTLKVGERYPIETSSYSSVSLPAIAGISAAAAAAASQTVPQIQYEDIGLTFKATPRVMRSNDVALTVELKIESLGGSSINNIPILNNQQFSGVLTLKEGETAVLVNDLSRQESRALSGLPGISDIPGLQDVSDIAKNQNVARLLILVTPSVVRNVTQLSTHSKMLMVDKAANAH